MERIYGDGRDATESEATSRLGETAGAGIYLGRFYDAEKQIARKELFYKGDRHLLVFGPTGSGKSTRFLMPSLLLGLDDCSTVVIDPKGEIAAATANHRRSLGHDVVMLNPFGVAGFESVGFNPLIGLDPDSQTAYDDAAGIGEALIRVEGSEPHWAESAQGLIAGLILWEATLAKRAERPPSLSNVRKMLTAPEQSRTDDKGKKRLTAGFRKTVADACVDGGFIVESLLGRFVRENDEIASIQSTADTQTRWLLSKPMRADLDRRGIDFAALKKKRTTVYLILPAERLRTHGVWLRLVIVSALRALYQPGGFRTVLMIDEMAALGHLAPLEDAFGLVRGYNIQIAAITQDLSQLKALYKERWETFIANAGVVFGFAPNDLTTADWMSKRTGPTTVVAKGFSSSKNISAGVSSSSSSGTTATDTQVARPLMLPHELIGLGNGMGVLWLAGEANTVRFFAPYYLDIEACRAGASR